MLNLKPLTLWECTREDMAYFLEQAPGCFFCLGVGQEGGFPIHNSRFDFDEDVLLDGVETYCRVALRLLR